MYLNEIFPALELKQPLFYTYPIGIRFDLGGELNVSEGRMEQCYARSHALFSGLNKLDDELFVIVFIDSWDDYPISESEPEILKIFQTYFYVENISVYVSKDEIKYRYEDAGDDEGTKTFRFWIRCKVKEVNYKEIITAKINQSIEKAPFIIGDLYLVNKTNNTIFHVYDDRGVDIVANSTDALMYVYEKFNDWILEYDRTKIEQIFK